MQVCLLRIGAYRCASTCKYNVFNVIIENSVCINSILRVFFVRAAETHLDAVTLFICMQSIMGSLTHSAIDKLPIVMYIHMNYCNTSLQCFHGHILYLFYAHCVFRIQLSSMADLIEITSVKEMDGHSVATSNLNVTGGNNTFSPCISEPNDLFGNPDTVSVSENLSGIVNKKQAKRKVRRGNIQKKMEANAASVSNNKRNRSLGTSPINEPTGKRIRHEEQSRFVAILAQSNSTKFTEAQASTLSAALSSEFYKASTEFLPLFISAGMVRGNFEAVGRTKTPLSGWM